MSYFLVWILLGCKQSHQDSRVGIKGRVHAGSCKIRAVHACADTWGSGGGAWGVHVYERASLSVLFFCVHMRAGLHMRVCGPGSCCIMAVCGCVRLCPLLPPFHSSSWISLSHPRFPTNYYDHPTYNPCNLLNRPM